MKLLAGGAPSEHHVYTAKSASLALDRSAKSNGQVIEHDIDDVSRALAFVESDAPAVAGGPWGLELAEKGSVETTKQYRFLTFYHPYTNLFIRQLNRFGIDGLLRPGPTGPGKALHRQLTPDSDFMFGTYGPQAGVVQFPFPTEEIDFKEGGSYSDYNWEMFFHIPILIANRLSQNQRFEDAQRWYHYIFDPTETDETGLEADEAHRRFWKIKPFFEFSKATSIQEIVELINQGNETYANQVSRWEDDPFNPHLLARHRVVSYMKMVVMKYLDNLIAWADNLFRQDTLETINQATQLYVLAANIMGRRPVQVPGRETAARTFDDLRDNLDAFSNALVTLENELKWSPPFQSNGVFKADKGAAGKNLYLDTEKAALKARPSSGLSAAIQFGSALSWAIPPVAPDIENPLALYFCIPNNEKLLEYFDVLADRLFKIRNCMNIEGIRRTLDLFEPPIDPALLVKAAAAGADLSSALDDLNAPLPHYRFTYILQKAMSLCQEVKGLGGALLAALEKKDAEALAVLRAGNQIDILKSSKAIKRLSIEEMKENLAGLESSKTMIQHRIAYYGSREFKNASERNQEAHLEIANVFQLFSQGYDLAANIAHLIPQLKGGVQGVSSPEITASFGGQNLGQALQVYSKLYSLIAAIHSHKATMAGIKAGHERRQEDWDFQRGLAEKELEQVEQQKIAAEIRVQIAEKDLENLDVQIDRAQDEEAFLKEKFTNEQLYTRMISQVSSAYFQTYQMAYDLAKRAERCFQHALGVQNTHFIEFGYWDNLIKGLHAGDRLLKDLNRMETAYIEQNRREYELVQHFSLALLNPDALVNLRETGRCEFDLPELAFDICYPGHYMRRIKSVSLTIPCVTGPFTNVSARLTLLRNRVRVSGTSQGDYAYTGLNDPNFRHDLVGTQSIATSSAQNDSGLFEFNFRDERFLPFERAGAISTWQLDLPKTFHNFDYDSISDVILHLNYTAREGGDALGETVSAHIQGNINQWLDETAQQGQGLSRLFSLKREFPSELHRLLFPAEGEPQSVDLDIGHRHFPYFLRGRTLTATAGTLYLKLREDASPEDLSLNLDTVEDLDFSPVTNPLTNPKTEIEGLFDTQFSLNRLIGGDNAQPWPLQVASGNLDPEAVEDLCLLITYTVSG